MNEPSIHMASWPVKFFLHYLKNLSTILSCAEIAQEKGGCARGLIDARLAPDMFPLRQQAATAISFSVRALCPLVDLDPPNLGNAEDFLMLRQQVEQVVDFLEGIPPNKFEGFETRAVKTTAGFAEHHFSGRDFLVNYAIPNFLFHCSMVYAILRVNGVELSKGDFDAFHEYPAGFSFESPSPQQDYSG